MSNFEEKEMYLYDSETSSEPFSKFVVNISPSFDGYVFSKICRDTIGLSSTNPTWGDLYRYTNHELYYIGICIYKEMDYDMPNAPYSEKMWSLLGKRALKNCLVPDITLVKDKTNKEIGLLSHIILDNSLEDLTLMNNLLFYKFERQDLSKLHSIIHIQDLLECVRIQIGDEQNYTEVESQIVQTLLLDSITNNSDRHVNNWGLVRNKESNHYTLGLFDHSSSFIDMISEKKGATIDGWTSTYTSVSSNPNRSGIGDLGSTVVTYLCKHYPDVCKQFMCNLNLELESFYKDISSAPYKNIYRIGILARISNTYYLKTYTKKSNHERDAYSHGYIGIPGFIPGRLYTSTNQLFDFFKRRVFAPNSTEHSIDFLEELKKTNGISLTDSFSIEEMPEKYRQSCKNILESLSYLEKEKEDSQK